jgi:hypothetical protein
LLETRNVKTTAISSQGSKDAARFNDQAGAVHHKQQVVEKPGKGNLDDMVLSA